MTTTSAPPSVCYLTTPAQLAAIAHPLRLRVLRAVVREAMTNQQLADALHVEPAKLHFHVRTLAAAGLITLVEERPKGGVIEKYYRAVADSYRLAPGLLPGGEG